MIKIALAYRDNALFRTWIPRLVEGFEVVAQLVIPQGGSAEDLTEEQRNIVELAVSAGAQALWCDSTCQDLCRDRAGRLYSSSLDYLFQSGLPELVKKMSFAEKLIWCAQQLTQDRTFQRIVVVKRSINDHSFGLELPETVATLEEWIATTLADEFGVPATIAFTLEEAIDAAAHDPNAMLVMDRHCGVKDVMPEEKGWYNAPDNWNYPSALLLLPFDTCINHLIAGGRVDLEFNLETMCNEMVRRAKK